MLTLSLLRHGDATRGDPAVEDFDRPLSERGEEEAAIIKGWLAARKITPDRVLASPSQRTRATYEAIAGAFATPARLTFDENLYSATPRTLMALLAKVDDDQHVLIVGHNPGLHALATALIDSGPTDLRARLDDEFPPGSLVLMEIDAPRFAELEAGTARLLAFVTPDTLRS